MDIHGIDPVIVDNGPQPGAGKCNLGLGIFLLQKPGVHACGKGILPEIVKPQQGAEAHAPHAAHQGPLLGIDAVGENPLVPGQMEGLVFIRIIGFLEHGHIIRPALVKISVFIGV